MTSLYENTARTLNLANVVSNVPKNIPHQGRMWSVLSPVTFYTLVRSRVRYFFFLKHFCQCSLARNFVSFAIFENDFCITLFVVVSWRWRIRVLYEEIKTRWSVKWTECIRHTGHSEKNSFKTALCDSLFIAAIYQFICDFSGKRGKLFYNLFASWLNKYVGFRFRNGQFSFVCALTCDVWRILLIGFPDFNSISIYHPNCFCSTSKTKHWWDVLDDLFFAVLVELKVK